MEEELAKYSGDHLYAWKDIDENSGSNVIHRSMSDFLRYMPVKNLGVFLIV